MASSNPPPQHLLAAVIQIPRPHPRPTDPRPGGGGVGEQSCFMNPPAGSDACLSFRGKDRDDPGNFHSLEDGLILPDAMEIHF